MGVYTIGVVGDDAADSGTADHISGRRALSSDYRKHLRRTLCELAREHRFDAFLMDIEISGGSGIELCRNIRSMKVYRRTPIICITGAGLSRYSPQRL